MLHRPQVEGKLDEALEEFLSQTARVEEAQNSLLRTTREHSRLVRDVTGSSVDEGLDTVYETAGLTMKICSAMILSGHCYVYTRRSSES